MSVSLLVALQSQSVAGPIITASATFAGVIAGGFLAGAVQTHRENKREKHQTKVGSRLVAADLADAAAALTCILDSGNLIPQQIPTLPSSWDTYREALAARLTSDAWAKVRAAVAVIGTLSRELPALAPGGALARPSDATLARISDAAALIDEAIRALESGSGRQATSAGSA